MRDLDFANPGFLYLLLLLLPYIVYYIWQHSKTSADVQVSDTRAFSHAGHSYKNYLRHLPFFFRNLALIALIIAIARPQSTKKWSDEVTKGIDIVMAIDISTSMLAMDLKPDRLAAAKDVALNFISGRKNDRIGLVTFAGESFTQCPVTTDHAVLINLFRDVETGMLEDGTAIGMGLATAVKRLKESDAKSKVIILLTDGENNRGDISPVTAAEIANTYGIRVYTIGVGSRGKAPYPFEGPFGRVVRDVDVNIDEDVLRQIAQITDGSYFRATNNDKLKAIYEEIDKLEKSRINVKKFSEKKEEYFYFALMAGLLLLVEWLLRQTILRKIP